MLAHVIVRHSYSWTLTKSEIEALVDYKLRLWDLYFWVCPPRGLICIQGGRGADAPSWPCHLFSFFAHIVRLNTSARQITASPALDHWNAVFIVVFVFVFVFAIPSHFLTTIVSNTASNLKLLANISWTYILNKIPQISALLLILVSLLKCTK